MDTKDTQQKTESIKNSEEEDSVIEERPENKEDQLAEPDNDEKDDGS